MEFCKEKARFYAYVEMQDGISDKDIHEKLTTAFPDAAPSYHCGARTSGTIHARVGVTFRVVDDQGHFEVTKTLKEFSKCYRLIASTPVGN